MLPNLYTVVFYISKQFVHMLIIFKLFTLTLVHQAGVLLQVSSSALVEDIFGSDSFYMFNIVMNLGALSLNRYSSIKVQGFLKIKIYDLREYKVLVKCTNSENTLHE